MGTGRLLSLSWLGVAVAALPLVTMPACENVPVHDVAKSFEVEVSQITGAQGKIELDFLWVIDNSPSMSSEQYALSRSFGEFVEKLEKYLANIDIRLAVTTTDAIGNCGQFMNTPAKEYPPAAYESVRHPCLGNEDCVKKFGGGWECKPYPADKMYNKNRSVNSYCTKRCDTAGDCCAEFCFADVCGEDQTCLKSQCQDAPVADCTYECKHPGEDIAGCLRPPDTADCPSSLPRFLTMNTLDRFKCLALVPVDQTMNTNIEQGLKAAWLSLNPAGPNGEQVKSFLRDDAYLVVVFVTDEDDCSVDPDFSSPSFACEDDGDCPGSACGQAACRTDVGFSQFSGQAMKVCSGAIKKDYYNNCSLLGDYEGDAHHELAYHPGKADCSADDDCDYGWACSKGKCRPDMFGLPGYSSYAQPAGSPLHSLTPVAEFYSQLRSLKSDPAKVLVAAIVGDGMPRGQGSKEEKEEPSLISNACLDDGKLMGCQAYKAVLGTASDACRKQPDGEGCEDVFSAKLDCIRDCYIAAKGNLKQPTVAKNSYVCLNEYGAADFGSRYLELVEMFGPNGKSANLCGGEGIVPALETIAELIIRRVTKICLPSEVKEGEALVVLMHKPAADGSVTTVQLKEGDAEGAGDFRVESPTQACCFPDEKGECTGTLKAITFNQILDPEASIEVRYEAQPTVP